MVNILTTCVVCSALYNLASYVKISIWIYFPSIVQLVEIIEISWQKLWCCLCSSCLQAMTLGGLNWFPLACFVAEVESLWTSARSVWHPNPISDSVFVLAALWRSDGLAHTFQLHKGTSHSLSAISSAIHCCHCHKDTFKDRNTHRLTLENIHQIKLFWMNNGMILFIHCLTEAWILSTWLKSEKVNSWGRKKNSVRRLIHSLWEILGMSYILNTRGQGWEPVYPPIRPPWPPHPYFPHYHNVWTVACYLTPAMILALCMLLCILNHWETYIVLRL